MGSELDRDGHARPLSVTRLVSLGSSSVVAAVLACHSGAIAAPADVCPVTSGAAAPAPAPAHAAFRILVFSRTTGYRHASIPAAITAVEVLGSFNNFAVDATEDPTVFNDANLARFAAVVFLNTTGDVLDSAQQAAFERYVRGGHGFVGVHSASDTEYDWSWYHTLLGAKVRFPPGDPAGDRDRRGHGTAVHARAPQPVGAHGRVVQLQGAADGGVGAGQSRRNDVRRREDGGRAPDHLAARV